MKFLIGFLLCVLSTTSASSQAESDPADYIICSFYPPPEFPGGYDSLNAFIQKNTDRKIANDCNEGIVYIQFMVDETGAISHVKVMVGFAKACDQEAKRIVNSMPKWSPTHQWGKPIRVIINYPIRFSSL